ncbi:hypothetical protein Noda2021_03530 [Candidatus Dependentiae bacterium Noda2021]|nr:hypothetical protein Noda2021_03530 [Candidatus Dependentiae bacterium Noda2021]
MKVWLFTLSWFACAIHAQELPEHANRNHCHPDIAYCTYEPCYRWDNYFYETNDHDTFEVLPITAQPPQDMLPLMFVNIIGYQECDSYTSVNEPNSPESGVSSPKYKYQKSPVDRQTISDADAAIAERFSNHGTIRCCNSILASRTDVVLHFLQHHNFDLHGTGCPYPDCTYTSTKDTRRLADHYIQEHFIPLVFFCPLPGCFTKLKSRAALLVHMRKDKSNIKKKT